MLNFLPLNQLSSVGQEEMEKAVLGVTAVNGRFHVEEIRTKKYAIGKKESDPSIEDLHHAVTSLLTELRTKDAYFLMELV